MDDKQKLMFEIALTQYGIREWPGKNHNPEVVKYFTECGFSINDDETSWCGAAMCWCAMKAGLEFPEAGISARSWLNWGTKVFEPMLGDIVVFWREKASSWKGHVGMYVRNDGSKIWVLGGNQGDSWSIAPYAGSQLLGFRRWMQ